MSEHDTAVGSGSRVAAAPTAGRAAAMHFVLRALGWGAVLFGLLRLDWIQQHLLIPFAGLQQQLGCALLGASPAAVRVDQSCTASDAMALCVGAIFAFPAPWRRRLAGAALGLGLILAANTLRVGQLSLIAGDRQLFELLHLQLWPAALIVLTAGYVFWWMRRSGPGGQIAPPAAGTVTAADGGRGFRFLTLTVLFVSLYYLFVDQLLASAAITRAAELAAAAAGRMMSLAGVTASVSGGFLRTPHGAWLVTPECVLTPLVAVYLAAVGAARLPPGARALAVLAAVPLFLLLGTLRLLVLALPRALVGSHAIGLHAFYQLLAAVALVALFAVRGGGRRRAARLAAALAAGGLVALLVGHVDLRWLRPALGGALEPLHLGHGYTDAQGTLLLLPAFQLGLAAALWVASARRPGTRTLLGCLALLAGSQLLLLVALGELATHAGFEVPVVLLRAWSVLLPVVCCPPLLVAAAAGRRDPARFWNEVGARFPDLGGAASTSYYLECEQRLFRELLGDLDGLRILKTDLWDEARNTRILRWAAARGARVDGIDISLPTTTAARRGFRRRRLRLGAVAADVREIPFADGSFDAVYSMGTIEHFDETEAAMSEIRRVLAPGGRAIVGVPNRRDPFLRPLLVTLLEGLGLYAYGFEKSYSRAALRRLCAGAGLEVVAETGILFIPGWLRMLDLACHVWLPPASRLTGLAVRPFAWAYRRFPAVRRHGYLIAAVGVRPPASTSSSRQRSEPASKHQPRSRSTRAAALRAFEAR